MSPDAPRPLILIEAEYNQTRLRFNGKAIRSLEQFMTLWMTLLYSFQCAEILRDKTIALPNAPAVLLEQLAILANLLDNACRSDATSESTPIVEVLGLIEDDVDLACFVLLQSGEVNSRRPFTVADGDLHIQDVWVAPQDLVDALLLETMLLSSRYLVIVIGPGEIAARRTVSPAIHHLVGDVRPIEGGCAPPLFNCLPTIPCRSRTKAFVLRLRDEHGHRRAAASDVYHLAVLCPADEFGQRAFGVSDGDLRHQRILMAMWMAMLPRRARGRKAHLSRTPASPWTCSTSVPSHWGRAEARFTARQKQSCACATCAPATR